MRWRLAAVVIVAACDVGTPAFADEGGASFWLLGSYASYAAVPGDTGLSIDTTFYAGTASAGRWVSFYGVTGCLLMTSMFRPVCSRGNRQCLGQGAGEVGMKLDKRIELATVERAGLNIGQCFALKCVLAADLQITDTVARSTRGNDLTTTVIESARDRDNPPPRDLEERSHGFAFAKQDLPLAPLPLSSEGE